MSQTAFAVEDHWRLDHTAGPTVVDSVFSSQPSPNVGGSPTWTLAFRGGTGVPTDFKERFASLHGFADFAGSYSSDVSIIDNTLLYTEQIGPSEESLLAALRPPDGDDRLRGAWGLIENVEDKTEPPLTSWKLDFTMTYIAPLSAYETLAEARQAHEREGWIR